jgi:quercetin dioxygenase-like cupin family protein
MLSSKEVRLGDIRGSVYEFDVAGDMIPKHVHDENSNHITIVLAGRIKVYSHDWEMEADVGRVLDFEPEQPHEILALEDNTKIINIRKKMGVE